MKADLIPLLYPGITSRQSDPRLYVEVSRRLHHNWHSNVGAWKDEVEKAGLRINQPPVDWNFYDVWPSDNMGYLVINRRTLRWWVFDTRAHVGQGPTAVMLNNDARRTKEHTL